MNEAKIISYKPAKVESTYGTGLRGNIDIT